MTHSALPAALPDADRLHALTEFAVRLADASAERSLRYFRQPIEVEHKENDDPLKAAFDPVTRADREAEASIRQLIEANYPDHSIHGEEYGLKDTGGDFGWVLDPIDGTRAYIAGLPTWGTLISLTFQGQSIIGIIDHPALGERYVGAPLGTVANGKRIEVRACPALSQAIMTTTDADLFGPLSPEATPKRRAFEALRQKTRLIRYGLDCYGYAVLASGHMDIVFEAGLEPYDMMALLPVVRGAGGVVTDWQGRPAAAGTSDLIACSDPRLLEPILNLIDANKGG